MKNNCLKNHLITLQNKYLNILQKALMVIESKGAIQIVDEVRIFWYTNRNLIDLILHNYFNKTDTYIFTGSTFVDIANKELYPFVTLGEDFIIDDSVSNLSLNIEKIQNSEYKDELLQTLKLCIEDNIKIIETYSDFIFILPVSYLTTLKNLILINKKATQFTLSLFQTNNLTVEKFFQQYKNIEELFNDLKEEIKDEIIFTEHDSTDNILDRFNCFKQDKLLPFDKDINDVTLFFFTINGYFMRALSISLFCYDYNLIPYLRYPLIEHYFLFISNFAPITKKVKNNILKNICSYNIQKNLNINKVSHLNLQQYKEKICHTNFTENIDSFIDRYIVNRKSISLIEIEQKMTTFLKTLYDNL